MTRRKARPSKLRSEAGYNRRGEEQPCMLMCSSGKPATHCIAGVLICQPCNTKTKQIEADAEGPESIRSIVPRVLGAIERGGAA